MVVRPAVRTVVLVASLLFISVGDWTLHARPQEPHQITITARKYQFEPARIEVKSGTNPSSYSCQRRRKTWLFMQRPETPWRYV
jgi:hypothetical protein